MVFFQMLPVVWVWQQYFLTMNTSIFEFEGRLDLTSCLTQNATQTLFDQSAQAGLALACEIFCRCK